VKSRYTLSLQGTVRLLCLFALLLSSLAGCSGGSGIKSAAPSSVPAQTAPQAKFVVFDSTVYKGKPDLESFGLRPISVVGASSMWTKSSDTNNVPDPAIVRTLALQANQSTGIAAIDIEQWALDGDPATVAKSIEKYMKTLQMFQQYAPSLQVGYYGVAPIRDYWDSIGALTSPGYWAWQQANDHVSSIAHQANALFPSVYTFYADQDGWQKYAIAQISEARRIGPGKPIYVFLCPQYVDGDLSGDYLPASYWRMELETAKKYADGLVIWDGWNQAWDNNAPWWLETQQFLREIGQTN
jgi:Hyaluronidase